LAEILQDDTYEGPGRTEVVSIETGSRILPSGGVISHFVWGHISAADQDIFTKFGVYVENGVRQHVEWSKYAFLENPRWLTAAMSK